MYMDMQICLGCMKKKVYLLSLIMAVKSSTSLFIVSRKMELMQMCQFASSRCTQVMYGIHA
jgi:hypothetical protein